MPKRKTEPEAVQDATTLQALYELVQTHITRHNQNQMRVWAALSELQSKIGTIEDKLAKCQAGGEPDEDLKTSIGRSKTHINAFRMRIKGFEAELAELKSDLVCVADEVHATFEMYMKSRPARRG